MAAELVGADGTQLLQQLERAKTRVQEIRRHLDRAEHAIARTINGQDGEGAVEIVLGADGNVEAVHLDPDWRELVDEQGLPAAVTEAHRAAHGSRLADWCGALRESLGARGWVPMVLRAQTEAPDGPRLLGPDPDLSGIDPDLSDGQVAAEVRAALHRATGAGPHAAGTEGAAPAAADRGAGAPADARRLREQVVAAFGDLSVAIDAAPAWLDITLVVSGAQTVLGMLREVTEPLLHSGAGAPESQVRLTGGLDVAVRRARSLLGIPEGLGVALGAVTDFVTVAGPGLAGGR
ncbi:YbaB/EbfC family nucleoid-associated protein [Ruania albidiflava]|uniref:YbaB/EbfC family nucleoid-associated protein n=1 Tax=Ruania albidiflava TaxID=366586 RepID=UPI0003B35B48|nr:YbaB/EbfC family nucleoid-associated protein [Ruania albidiflava]